MTDEAGVPDGLSGSDWPTLTVYLFLKRTDRPFRTVELSRRLGKPESSIREAIRELREAGHLQTYHAVESDGRKRGYDIE